MRGEGKTKKTGSQFHNIFNFFLILYVLHLLMSVFQEATTTTDKVFSAI